MRCRHCKNELENVFLDLGFAPPSNAYLSYADLHKPELYYPLKLFVCDACWLVQTDDYTSADQLFQSDYAYFSSVSRSWLAHAEEYANMIQDRLGLGSASHVVELASNDGYLLKNFVSAGIPCLGIEPTASTADAAEKLGIPVLREFFGKKLGQQLAKTGQQADLVIGNNVFAHVPDINDFTDGIQAILKVGGTVTLEFPHLLRLIEHNQFDTVYHEHFSYLSLIAVIRIFEKAGLKVFDIEELPTHGGSLRIYGCRQDDSRQKSSSVDNMVKVETESGLKELKTYLEFQSRANKVKNDLLSFLILQKQSGKTIVAYGAAAKGNTLLNYAGIKKDIVEAVYDAAPSKQGKYLPGSHIPVLSPDELADRKPDWVLILPWNITEEVMAQCEFITSWGGRFVVAVPEIRVC